jgi:hypothetical protein
MRKIAEVFLLTLSLSGNLAIADDGRVWILNTYTGGAQLVFGTPESGDVVINFKCEKSTKNLDITVNFGFVSMKGLPDDTAVNFTVKVGSAQSQFSGRTWYNEEDGNVAVSATGDVSAKAIQALKSARGAILIEMRGDAGEVSLKTLGNKASRFLRACGS